MVTRPELTRRLFNVRMRAIEFHGGERLELVERPDPTPGDGELLIAPTAVGICGTDVEIFEGSLAYFRKGIAQYPIVPGHEWTGEVVDVGARRHRLLAGRPGRGGGGDRLRRMRALPRGADAPVRAAPETGIVHMDGAMASRLVFPAALRAPGRLDGRRGARRADERGLARGAPRRCRRQARAGRRRGSDRPARRAVRAARRAPRRW